MGENEAERLHALVAQHITESFRDFMECPLLLLVGSCVDDEENAVEASADAFDPVEEVVHEIILRWVQVMNLIFHVSDF